ncbi:MAG: hypothetical protein SOI24_09900 [Coriobacteriales bacterium]|jgi:hypothetical protein
MTVTHTNRGARITRACLAATLGLGLAAFAAAPAQALPLSGVFAASDTASADGAFVAKGASSADASSAARNAAPASSAASDATAYVAPTTLSADPRSLQLQIDGALFQLPCPVSELQAIGLRFDEGDAGTIVEAGYSMTASMYFGDPSDYVYVTTTVINTGTTELPIEQCTVEAIYARTSALEGHAVVTAGGLALGAATRSDVEALLGKAERPYEDAASGFSELAYDGAEGTHDRLDYTFKDGVLNDCSLDSGVEYTLTRDSSADSARAQVAAGTTYARVTPAIPELSSDPFAFQIKFGDTVMQAPGYVADFLALGFTMEPKDVGDVLDAHYSTSITLDWGDPDDFHYINVSIYNPGDNPVTFEQCMVDDIYVTDVMPEVMTVTTPGGITLGTSTIDDVQAVYGTRTSYEYRSDDGSYVTLEYEAADGDFANNMSFSFVDGVLDSVTVSTRGM